MSADPSPAADRPTRWGLAVKLFGALLLLGGLAVLVTSVLGYVRARDALEESIYQQLTVARQTKARQVEEHFRTVRQDLLLLAHSRMVVEAARGFRAAVEQLDQAPLPDGLRSEVEAWYEAHYMPEVRRLLGKDVALADYLPVTASGHYLQYHYIVANPHPPGRRELLDDAHDGSRYSRLHAIDHPLLRTAADTVGFADFLMADARSGAVIYGMDKELDFGTSLQRGPYRTTNLAAAVARCAGRADPSATCLEDFAPFLPSDGEPNAFMAAPVIDQGVVIGVLVAQLSIARDRPGRHRRPALAPGRLWRHRRSLHRRSGLPAALGWPAVSREIATATSPNWQAEGEPAEEIAAIKRYGSPVLHQRIDTQATRAALAGIEGTGRIIGNYGKPTLASWGPLDIPGVRWGLVAKIEIGGGVRADQAPRARPRDRGRPDARGGDRDRRLAVALPDRAACAISRRARGASPPATAASGLLRARATRSGSSASPSTAWSTTSAPRTC